MSQNLSYAAVVIGALRVNLPFLNNNEEMMAALNAPILKTIDSPLLAALNSNVIKALEGSMDTQKTTEINQVSNPLVGIKEASSPVTSSEGAMGLSVATTPSCSIPPTTVTSASSLVAEDVTKVTGSVGTLSTPVYLQLLLSQWMYLEIGPYLNRMKRTILS